MVSAEYDAFNARVEIFLWELSSFYWFFWVSNDSQEQKFKHWLWWCFKEQYRAANRIDVHFLSVFSDCVGYFLAGNNTKRDNSETLFDYFHGGSLDHAKRYLKSYWFLNQNRNIQQNEQ